MSDEYEDAVVDIVQQVYAEEEEAAQEYMDRVCGKSWFEEAITLIPYVGPVLLDTSCTYDPPPMATMEPRVAAAIKRIEDGLQLKLDDETKKNIREDIGLIWKAW
jgi:hypothetical protein